MTASASSLRNDPARNATALCPQCGYGLTHAAGEACPECGLPEAGAHAQSDDLCPWAWRHRQGTLLAFIRTIGIVFTLNRRHLRRWGRLSVAEGRKSTRFAWVVGVWVLANALLAYAFFGTRGETSAVGVLTTLLILLPIPLLILVGTVLGQTGVVSLVARRAGRVLQTGPRIGGTVDGFHAPEAHDEDLTCPECGYNLAGLPHDRCPECGLQGAVTLARRGHYVEVEHNVWPIVAYGTACWVPALVVLDLLAVVQFGTAGFGPQALVAARAFTLWPIGVSLAVSAVWWIVYHLVALERTLAKPLSVWHDFVLVLALVLPTGLGAATMVLFLGAIWR